MSSEDSDIPLVPPLPDAELKRALQLTPEERLEYFLEQLYAHELCWVLGSQGQILRLQLEDGRTAIPVFPRQEFAALEAEGSQEQPKMLGIEEFFDGLLLEMQAEEMIVGVFPVKGAALLMEAMALYTRILEEWEEED